MATISEVHCTTVCIITLEMICPWPLPHVNVATCTSFLPKGLGWPAGLVGARRVKYHRCNEVKAWLAFEAGAASVPSVPDGGPRWAQRGQDRWCPSWFPLVSSGLLVSPFSVGRRSSWSQSHRPSPTCLPIKCSMCHGD